MLTSSQLCWRSLWPFSGWVDASAPRHLRVWSSGLFNFLREWAPHFCLLPSHFLKPQSHPRPMTPEKQITSLRLNSGSVDDWTFQLIAKLTEGEG